MTGPLHTRLFECMGGASAGILNPQILWFQFQKSLVFGGFGASSCKDTIPMETAEWFCIDFAIVSCEVAVTHSDRCAAASGRFAGSIAGLTRFAGAAVTQWPGLGDE